MTFFVDANVFIYASGSGPRTEGCERIVEAMVDGADGRTSVAVLEEVWHIELSEPDIRPGTCARLIRALAPILPVTESELSTALGIQVEGPGANDRLHAATCATNGIDTIVSADRDFDAFDGLRRVDPTDVAAIDELLAN